MRLVLDARTATLGGLLDEAEVGLSVGGNMVDAVERHRDLRSGRRGWVLGQFMCASSRLEHLAAVATAGMTRAESPWPIAVVFDMSPGAAASVCAAFQNEMSPAMSIHAAVLRAPVDTAELPQMIDTAALIDPDIAVFVGVDRAGSISAQIHAIGAALRDSGRSGGAVLDVGDGDGDPERGITETTEFLWEASFAGVPYRIIGSQTSGITDSIQGRWNPGLVNLVIGCAATDAGESRRTVRDIVGDEDPDAFSMSAIAATWRDVTFAGSAVRTARHGGLLSYGTRDIRSTLDDLADLAFLGDGT